jgi:hypothetical protein
MAGFQADAFQEDGFQTVADPAALTQARFNVMRFGASRFGDFYPTPIVSIGGTNLARAVRLDTLEILDRLNEELNEARFILRETDSTPTEGQTVIIALGTADDYTRLFTGSIVRVQQIQQHVGQEISYAIEAMDYTWLLDRRFVTKSYVAASASFIAYDLITTFTTGGFTPYHVELDLPILDDFQVTNERPSTVLTRLANIVGAKWYLDGERDLHFFTEETDHPDPPDMDDDTARYWGVQITRDMSQIRTRAIVEGRTTQVAAPVSADDTIVPVEDVSIFSAYGGDARIGTDLIAYTGTVTGGGGSLVGPGVAPPTAPVATPAAGAGIESGVHLYAYTWVTGSGESLPSPAGSVTLGLIASPASAPTLAHAAGSELGAGTYQYAVTNVVGAGETTQGPIGAVVTSSGIAAPGSSPAASATWFPQEGHNGGRYVPGNSVYCRVSYVDVSGNETGGTDSNTVVATSWTGSEAGSVLFNNLPSPSDPNVVTKRLYLNVNGTFVAYKNLAPSTFSDSWYDAGTSGSFPVGGSPLRRRVALSAIPLGPTGTTARKVYRTAVNGSSLLLVATIADNTTTTYADLIADGSLGAAPPISNTATLNQAAITGIAVGPSGVTSRNVYRTVAGGSTLKLLATIADNTTTAPATDTVADGSLGADAPSSDTSALTQPTGQVNAGATTIPVAGPVAFSTGGGWALVANQVVRYTGISGNTLTGIPASGTGSVMATVSYSATIIEAPRLTGVTGLDRAVTSGTDIVLRVTRNDLTAQATLAVIEDGDGIHEHLVSDDRLSIEQATERGDAELETFGSVIRSLQYQTRHPSTIPGRTITVDLSVPVSVSESFTIREVTLTGFDNLAPRASRSIKKFPIRIVSAAPVRLGSHLDQLSRGEDSR